MSQTPPPPPPPGAAPPPPPQPAGSGQSGPSTNGFAVAALVLGIIPVCAGILGIIFGFIARSQIKSSGGRQQGDGMALAGIICGFAWLAIIVVVWIIAIVAAEEADDDLEDFEFSKRAAVTLTRVGALAIRAAGVW